VRFQGRVYDLSTDGKTVEIQIKFDESVETIICLDKPYTLKLTSDQMKKIPFDH
jgi:hypothetical protein